MTKKVQTPETDILVESKGKVESFFDKYGNKLMWALVAVTIIAVGIFVWHNYSEKKQLANEQEAQVALFGVITEYDLSALDVDYTVAAESYAALAAKYPEAAAGNVARFMSASAYLHAGELDAAKAAIAKYENAEGNYGKVINTMALTLKGDIAVEEADYQTAANYFAKALKSSSNLDLYASNALKLALVYEAMNDDAKAQEVYNATVAKYPELTTYFAKYIKE